MATKQLGNSDLYITKIGIGSWAMGGLGYQYSWGPQEDHDSISAIHRALDLGCNWIDTAPGYGKGHSEETVARAVSSWIGPKPYVFTKCGLRWDEQGLIFKELSPARIRQECEDSLRRLRVETIDLMQIHWPTDDSTEVDGAWEMLARLQREGKIRWLGVSNFDVAQMQRAQTIARVTSLQPPYSLVHREAEAAILPYCVQENIGVIAYSPMYSGLLSGMMTRERIQSLPDSDWRKRDADFNEPNLSRNLQLVDRLREVGKKYGHSAGEVAIAWALHHPAVTGAIVGIRNNWQAEQAARAGDIQLGDDDLAFLEGR